MMLNKWMVTAAASLLVLMAAGLLSAFSASNTVTPSRMGGAVFPIDANALKPPECAALNLTTLVILARGDSPTNGNDLIIGTSGDDNINGGAGDDCILGGDGNDTLNGGAGRDVLLGGPGDDALDGGGGNPDACYGGGQAGDTFNRCEIVYP
jgi:Ca2+-binding RTX toxin-like protein